MKNKMGRPTLPKGEAKDFQFGVRLNSEQQKTISRTVKDSGQSYPDFARSSMMTVAAKPPVWVKSKWKAEELNGNFIEFRLDSPKRLLWGVGKLAVHENARGEISVDIFIDEPRKGISTRVWLAQDAVDRIELNPKSKTAKFRLLG
jgi:hypothetical protein